MRIARILGFALPAAAVMAAAAVLGAPELRADPGIGGCVNAVGVSACTNVGVGVPNINGVVNAIPNIPVPNINVPHLNPGVWHGGR